VQVLSVLVRAVIENIADAGGEPASHLRQNMLELFGHITSKVTNNVDIWRLYAELLASSNPLTDTLCDRVSTNTALSSARLSIFFVWYRHFLPTTLEMWVRQ